MRESQNVEWKSSWRDEYLKWLCGFANGDGGAIYIGKDDEGRTVGLEPAEVKRLLEDIPNKVISTLGIVCDARSERDEGGEYVCISVDPSPFPVSYRGEYHVRTGSTKQQLKGNALTRFIFERTGMSWESVPVEGCPLDSFRHDAFDSFRKMARSRRRMRPEDLALSDADLLDALNLVRDGKPTRAAVLLFHQEPQRFVPLSVARVGRFSADGALLYDDEVAGPLIEQPDKVVDLLFTKYMEAPVSYEGIHRVESHPYPEPAVRELVCNALAHSNWAASVPVQISVYPDRMYVANQAILPLDMTVEKLLGKHKSEPYNPLMAHAFYRAGLVETWGQGISKIRAACEAAGVPMAAFELDDSGVMACLMSAAADNGQTKEIAGGKCRNASNVSPSDNKTDNKTDNKADKASILGESEQAVLKYITARPSANQGEIAEAVGISRSSVADYTASLQRKGLLRREGSRKTGTWVVIDR